MYSRNFESNRRYCKITIFFQGWYCIPTDQSIEIVPRGGPPILGLYALQIFTIKLQSFIVSQFPTTVNGSALPLVVLQIHDYCEWL